MLRQLPLSGSAPTAAEGVDTGSGKAVWLDTPMIEKIGGEGTIERPYSGNDADVRKLRH